MSEDKVERSFRQFNQVLGIVSGISLALFISVLANDYRTYIATPFGCASLWMFTTIGSIPIGFRMAFSSWWKQIPFKDRRRTAVRYLLVGFVNLISLGIHNLRIFENYFVVYVALCYGGVLIYVFTRLYEFDIRERGDDDLFP
jgi:hypothetical protein